MADQSPLGRSEKGVHLDVGSASPGAQAAVLVFDKQFADQGLAETTGLLTDGSRDE